MYLNGEGIEQERVVANVWATVAFAQIPAPNTATTCDMPRRSRMKESIHD